MSARTFVRANARQTVVRFRASLAALAIGMSLLVASASVVGELVVAGARSLDTDSGLSTLELFDVSPSGPATPLTQAAVSRIRALPGVRAVVGMSSVGTSLSYHSGGGMGAAAAADQAFAGAFFALPRFAWSQPPVGRKATGVAVEGALGAGQVLLPDRYLDVDLTPLVGASIGIEFVRATGKHEGVPATMRARVVGVFDSSSPRRDGESALYVSDADFRLMFAALLGAPDATVPADATYSSCRIKAATVADAGRIARELTAQGFYVKTASDAQALPRALGALRQVNTLIGVTLALFGIGIGVTLAGTWSRLRRWDIGVLTSLGWTSREILSSHCLELTAVGFVVGGVAGGVGAVLTVAGGLVTHLHPILGLAQPHLILLPSVTWLLGALVAVPVAFVVGALPRLVRLSRIEPDDALRRSD